MQKMSSMISLWKITVNCQIFSSAVSFVASSAINVMIVRSGGLCSSWRRIIFALSLSDMLQSIGIISGPFSVPSSVPQGLWAVGNEHTCRLSGFVYTFSASSVSMYTVALCIYCHCKVKRNMNDSMFINRIERKLHGGIILFNLAVCFSALWFRILNASPSGSLCVFSAVPTGCRQNPEIFGECEQDIARFSKIYTLAFHVGVPFLCLGTIIGIMVSICLHVHTRDKIFQGSSQAEIWQNLPTTLRRRASIIDESCGLDSFTLESHNDTFCKQDNDDCSVHEDKCPKDTLTGATEDTSHDDRLKSFSLIKLYKRDLFVQAGLYVLVFLTTFTFFSIVNLMLVVFQTDIPTSLAIWTSFISPLGGLFNVLVYTRPKVSMLRRRNKNLSWIRAFWSVLKAGGEIPVESSELDRADSVSVMPSVKGSSIPPSDANFSNWNSGSFGDENIAYRAPVNWDYVQGRGSFLVPVMEEGSDCRSSKGVSSTSDL